MVTGRYNPKQPLPLIPVSDGAGDVVEIGAAVTELAVGDRVVATFAPEWTSGRPDVGKIRPTLGGPLPGMLQPEFVHHARAFVRFPRHLTYAEAACFPCAGLTAWSALEQASVTSGDTVLVQGTGGVSLFALALAKLRGARVLLSSKSAEKRARAEALGASATFDYVKTPKWSKVVRELTGGVGVDAVIEVGGGGTLGESIACTRPGGTIALIGVLAGAATTTALTPVLMQNLRIQGVYVGHREQLEALFRAAAEAELRPVIDGTFAMSEVPSAFARMEAGDHFGKIVIQVAAPEATA
jgi:NADPH:quinone reductase-like Zn-dependent oxidoreductase